jgi:3D (Asp-Asp-Asp) domain-containing protein
MNGIVARLTLLPPSRLFRGIIFIACCVLSVGLIGAVDTRTRDAGRTATATVAEADGAVELASYQPLTAHTLLMPAPAPAPAAPSTEGVELLQPKAGGKSLAALISSQIGKVLAPPPAPSARVIWMEVTAYCPCKKCCGPRAQGITASGRPVSHNGGRFVAADTKVLAFNTRLLIPGYADGAAVPVIDRGGAIKGHKLDVYFPTHDQAKQWGRRWVPVTVVE